MFFWGSNQRYIRPSFIKRGCWRNSLLSFYKRFPVKSRCILFFMSDCKRNLCFTISEIYVSVGLLVRHFYGLSISVHRFPYIHVLYYISILSKILLRSIYYMEYYYNILIFDSYLTNNRIWGSVWDVELWTERRCFWSQICLLALWDQDKRQRIILCLLD